MNQCPHCSNSFLKDDAVFCPSCGSLTGNRIPRSMLPDKASSAVAFFVFLISVFFPKGVFFGFALWAAKTDITPKAARTYGLCAILPWIIRWLIPRLLTILTVLLVVILAAVAVCLCFFGVIQIPAEILEMLPFALPF